MSDKCETKGTTAAFGFSRLLAWAGPGALALGLALVLALGLGAAGCMKQQPTSPKPPPVRLNPTTTQAEPELDARLRELQQQSADLAAVAHSLPGATPAENRDKLRRAFTLLTQILPRVDMERTGNEFDPQVTVVELTRSTLATSSPDLAIAPVVDRGLRATYNALDRVQHNSRYYDQDARLRGILDQLSAKRDDLDRTHGAEHDLVWAEMFTLTSDAVSQMVNSIADRLSGAAPTTQEATATAPASPTTPTTAPAEGGATPASPPPSQTTPTTAPAEASPAVAPATAPAAAPTTAPADAAPTTAPTTAPAAPAGSP